MSTAFAVSAISSINGGKGGKRYRPIGKPRFDAVSAAVLYKLLAIFLTVGIGWFAGRMRWL
ncbi:MAG TPA: hypothetical protein VGC70_13500, partial [Burkholderiales bacterium]